jgi:hypothetical protein
MEKSAARVIQGISMSHSFLNKERHAARRVMNKNMEGR